jgi:hypothetical protein
MAWPWRKPHAVLKTPVVACNHINNHAFGFVKGQGPKKITRRKKTSR